MVVHMIRPINEDQITVLMMLLLQPWWLQSPILSWREFQIVLIAKSLQHHQLGRKWWFPFKKKVLFLQFMHVKSNTKRNVRVKVDEIYFISQPKIFWLFNQYTLKLKGKLYDIEVQVNNNLLQHSQIAICGISPLGEVYHHQQIPKRRQMVPKNSRVVLSLSLSFFLSGQYQLVHDWVKMLTQKPS